MHTYEVAYVDSTGAIVVRQVEARGATEAAQLAGAPTNSLLSIVVIN